MMMFTDDSNQTRLAKDPAVVRFGKYYYMYYSNCRISCDSQGEEKAVWGIGIARSTDLENWEKLQDMDIEGELEANGICAPGALILKERYICFIRPTEALRRMPSAMHGRKMESILPEMKQIRLYVRMETGTMEERLMRM